MVCGGSMSEISIVLSDNEDGTLGVKITGDSSEGYSVSNHVTNLFLDMLKDLEKPSIITEVQ
jgi:hypothetical protein